MLAACTAYQAHEAHERRLTIAPDPVPCADGTPGACLRVTDALGDSWITHLDEIEGFTYEPGFAYELLVEEPSQVAEMEAATPPRLKLIQVLSKQASGEPSRTLDADLGGSRWVLSAIEPSGHSASDWAASGITAQFDVWGGRLSGNAGCNNYSAALAVSGDQIAGVPACCHPKGLPVADRDRARAGVSGADRQRECLHRHGRPPPAITVRWQRHGVSARETLSLASSTDARGPLALDEIRLVVARPGRHGDGHGGERLRAVVTQLKVRPERDRQRTRRQSLRRSPATCPADATSGPCPERKYQTSSTVRCATARETCPGPSVKCAMLPRVRLCEDPHLAAVRRDHVGVERQLLGR